jgi:hypothetical protein
MEVAMTQENVEQSKEKNSQRYERFESKRFETYGQAHVFACLKFDELTGIKKDKEFDSPDFRLRIRRRHVQERDFFDVISFKRLGLKEEKSASPEYSSEQETAERRFRKGGKKDRKRRTSAAAV